MSVESKDPSGMPESQSSGQAAEIKSERVQESSGQEQVANNQTVAYETYRKSVQQEKAARQKLQEAESKLKAVEAEKMEAQGKKDELIEFLKKENSEMKQMQSETEAKRIHEKVNSQVQKSALEMGCVDVDLVKSLIDVSDLDVDANAHVNGDSLALALDRLKRNKPYLFSGNKAAVVDAPPASSSQGLTPEKKNYSQLSDADARKQLESELAKFM